MDILVDPSGSFDIAYPHPTPTQTPNDDEMTAVFAGSPIGNFGKTLPHNQFGEVDATAYAALAAARTSMAYDALAKGDPISDQFVSPLAGLARDRLVPPFDSLAMDPAPKVRGASTGAEMVELYWMALLRDLSFARFATEPMVGDALADIRIAYAAAIAEDPDLDPGKVKLGVDLPKKPDGSLDIGLGTLFRCGLPGENRGPIVSQFFLRGVRYGAQFIDQRVQPYKAGRDYMVTVDDWLDVQHKGKDRDGNTYQTSRPELEGFVRPFLTMRDLATFVNQDALHQAYFNAALILLSEGYRVDEGNPYAAPLNGREKGFATYGGPHLLSLVSEVAARALKVVWHQKWHVHRRLRPEVYGGRIEMQLTQGRAYGLSPVALNSDALARVRTQQGTSLLPMPFKAGSPTHPSYGAGHATVAGACVTVLKAWFDGADPIRNPVDLVATDDYAGLSQSASVWGGAPQLPEWTGTALDVNGELDKIACNVALGRSMGGVHWRSDNTRSLRLGEQIAIVFLAREMRDCIDRKNVAGGAFREAQMHLQTFDRRNLRISPAGVFLQGSATPDPFYAAFL